MTEKLPPCTPRLERICKTLRIRTKQGLSKIDWKEGHYVGRFRIEPEVVREINQILS